MPSEPIVFAIFLVFTGAAVLASLALYARQSLLVAYIVLGCVLGPGGLNLVAEPDTIQQIGHIGIIFLLFLLGLNLHPQRLLHMLREATLVTLTSSLVFATLGCLVAWLFGFSSREGLLIGAVTMFSSTIIGLKLLPTTALHHRRMGGVIISVLLLQDIIAIAILLLLQAMGKEGVTWGEVALELVALPILTGFAFLAERYVLLRLVSRFDTIREYIFLAALGWCLGVAQLAHVLGLSYEMGAFIAGVALATSPISLFIAESLKPLRDFFVIMFFFSIGASFELSMLGQVAAPAIVLAVVMLIVKPIVFKALLMRSGESARFSWEVGIRLGQISEFALLISVLAVQSGVIGFEASYLIQATTLLTFIASSYLVVLYFPTPIAINDRLRRD